jgi:hypothetical protein
MSEITPLRAEVAAMPPADAIDHLLFLIEGMTGGPEPLLPGLTPLQSRIMRRLESAKGEVVSRDELLFSAYYDRSLSDWPEGDIIRVSIRHIRQRRPDLKIQTCRNLGYRLNTGD